jgi:hypothetical protein
MKSGRRWISVLAAAALLCSTGCFGSFGLTRKVYSFNDRVHDNKWVQEGVFVGLNFPLVPVYVLACLIDSVFFNSVEFWTGETLVPTERTPVPKAQPAPAPAPKVAPKPAATPKKGTRSK